MNRSGCAFESYFDFAINKVFYYSVVKKKKDLRKTNFKARKILELMIPGSAGITAEPSGE